MITSDCCGVLDHAANACRNGASKAVEGLPHLAGQILPEKLLSHADAFDESDP